jgi:hypothetical protein
MGHLMPGIPFMHLTSRPVIFTPSVAAPAMTFQHVNWIIQGNYLTTTDTSIQRVGSTEQFFQG